jgi:hypothetical protein
MYDHAGAPVYVIAAALVSGLVFVYTLLAQVPLR